MRLVRTWRSLLPLLLLPCAVTCYGATELRVSLTSDACRRGPRVAVYAGPDAVSARAAAPVAVQTDVACDGNGSLGDLVFVPSGTRDERVVIVVAASFDGGDPTLCPENGSSTCVVARRSARFVRHRSLELPVLLGENCLNVLCTDKNTTCVAGQCESAEVDDNPRLADRSPAPSGPLPDASPPMDSAVDASADAGDAAAAIDGATDACTWGDGTHAVVASRPFGPIASNTHDLYWITEGGQLGRLSKTGSASVTTSNASLPTRILVDDIAIYLGATMPTPSLRRLAFGSVMAQGISMNVRSLAQDGTTVFATSPNLVTRVVKNATWTAGPSVTAAPLDVPQGIAVAGYNVYWLEASGYSYTDTLLGNSARTVTLGGAPVAIVADTKGPVIAVASTAGGTVAGVLRFGNTGTGVVLVNDSNITDAALALDRDAVYFTRKTVAGAELRRIAGGINTLVDQATVLRGAVIDGPCLYYWADGNMMKRAKP